MTTRATPMAPALPAVDDSAANPRRPGTKPAWLLGAGGVPLLGTKLWSAYLPQAVPLAAGQRRRARDRAFRDRVLLGGTLLHPGHGHRVRLTAPTNPGVMQTRWLEEVTVL
jgi:hypothetical protein